MADINPNDSAILTDDLEIGSYDDVVNLFGAGEAAAMLADVVGNRFNRQEILKAIRNGGDIHLDYWPEYGEYDHAARICGELLADTSLAWADGLIDPDKIKTHKGLTAGDLSHAVTCVLTDRFNDGLDEARLADCKNIADEFAQAIESRLGSGRLGRELYVDGDCLRGDLADKFGFSYDIDFSGLSFKTSLILSVNGLYSEGENAGTFTVKPGTYEPIFGIYDPVGGCGGTMGTLLDRDFEIDPHDISYTMMEPVRGEWKSDRIDLYTPQDCFGFSDPFGGRIEYSEKKPKAVVAVKPDPVELGHRASVAASSTAGGRARGAGIRQ